MKNKEGRTLGATPIVTGSSGHHRRRALSIDDYVSGVRSQDRAVLARAVTLIESNAPADAVAAEQLLSRLLPLTGNAVRIGITGPTGVGKSTFIEAFGLHLIGQGFRVAVLAVDPSSEISGGSILGDKTRMGRLSEATNAFIRPSPSGGYLGGVAGKTRESAMICDAAGFDVILIETTGVGQSETRVADMTDCFLALMLPGAGDELQGIKRGLLELVDVIAVNKADGATRDAAELAAQQYTSALQSLVGADRGRETLVLTCSALHGDRIGAIWEAIRRRHDRMKQSGELDDRRGQQRKQWLWWIVEQQLRRALREHDGVRTICDELEQNVVAGTLAPEAAARRILDALGIKDADERSDAE